MAELSTNEATNAKTKVGGMSAGQRMRRWVASDLGVLILVALTRIAIQTVFNGRYGWHRDELATLEDAKHLAWGYVVYPPVTPFICRVSLVLFGPSLVMLRLFALLAQGGGMVLTGLMARELGAKRFWQIVAALAAAIAPVSLVSGTMFQYVSFDYLWWVLIAYFMIRLLKRSKPVGKSLGSGPTWSMISAPEARALSMTSQSRWGWSVQSARIARLFHSS